MHFSRIILKSALVASTLASPISTKITSGAGTSVDSVESTAQGFIAIGDAANTEVVATADVAIKRTLPDVGGAVSSVQSTAQAVASDVPAYSTVDSTAQGAVSDVEGLASSTGTLSTVEGLVRRALSGLGLSSTLSSAQSTTSGAVSEVEGVAGVDVVSDAEGIASSVESTASGAVSPVENVANTQGIVSEVETLAKRILSGLDGPVDTVESTAGNVLTGVEDKVGGVVNVTESIVA